MGLLRNGVTDVNTEDPNQLDAASRALRELTDRVNLRFYTNEYQHLADGSMWLHQAWSGDIAAIGYYMPKGDQARAQVSYWWPEDGRGLIGNDTFAVAQGGAAPGARPPLPRPHARSRRSVPEFRIHLLPAAAHRDDAGEGAGKRTGPGEPEHDDPARAAVQAADTCRARSAPKRSGSGRPPGRR